MYFKSSFIAELLSFKKDFYSTKNIMIEITNVRSIWKNRN